MEMVKIILLTVLQKYKVSVNLVCMEMEMLMESFIYTGFKPAFIIMKEIWCCQVGLCFIMKEIHLTSQKLFTSQY